MHVYDAGPIQSCAGPHPAVLERQEIVTERGSNELILSNRHRWGAPVAEMTRRTLTQDLLQRLQGNEVVLPEQPAPGEHEGDRRGHSETSVRCRAAASSCRGAGPRRLPGADTPSLTRTFSLAEQASATGYADQVQAMSRMLGQLADEIVSAVVR